MSIKSELNNLTEKDVYSLVLFAMYKMNESSEYSALSQLSYVLDKENLLKLCEYYGGMTIRIPTISELETFVYALQIYQSVVFDKQSIEQCVERLQDVDIQIEKIIECYNVLCDVLKNYNFNSGRE